MTLPLKIDGNNNLQEYPTVDLNSMIDNFMDLQQLIRQMDIH